VQILLRPFEFSPEPDKTKTKLVESRLLSPDPAQHLFRLMKRMQKRKIAGPRRESPALTGTENFRSIHIYTHPDIKDQILSNDT
jgi:hypothetical protein